MMSNLAIIEIIVTEKHVACKVKDKINWVFFLKKMFSLMQDKLKINF